LSLNLKVNTPLPTPSHSHQMRDIFECNRENVLTVVAILGGSENAVRRFGATGSQRKTFEGDSIVFSNSQGCLLSPGQKITRARRDHRCKGRMECRESVASWRVRVKFLTVKRSASRAIGVSCNALKDQNQVTRTFAVRRFARATKPPARRSNRFGAIHSTLTARPRKFAGGRWLG
jgi:hypothetical protein